MIVGHLVSIACAAILERVIREQVMSLTVSFVTH
jgi:hypothetical protein